MSGLLILGILLSAAIGGAQAPDSSAPNYDARIEYNEGYQAPVPPGRNQAVADLRREIPDLGATFKRETGVTRSLYNRTGYLSPLPTRAVDMRQRAFDFIQTHLPALGLTGADVASFREEGYHTTRSTNTTRLYLVQEHRRIPVYNGQLQINMNRDGRVLSVNNAFVPRIATSTNGERPTVSATEAVEAALQHLDLELDRPLEIVEERADPQRTTLVRVPGLNVLPIEVELEWLSIRAGETRLVWNLDLPAPDGQHHYDMTVDAATGRIWTRFDWVSSTEPQYTVYPQPVESPIHTTPLPPADARATVLDPADLIASPLRWHDTGSAAFVSTRGNNVHAYEDRDGNNAPPANEVVCAGDAQHCNFPIDLTQDPSAYIPASVTNLFYWNNVIHDVQYQYGFDEAAGNFQVNNFGNGGAGGDDVRAEAQDNVNFGNCNANFFTPPDGSRPRMQMFICRNTNPARDGSLDDGVVVHEYGHGISNRQVGGPANVSCLNNVQQPGEGWSDWFALAYTAEVGDQGTDPRGIGSYLFGLSATGTIRPQRYSTDPAVNNYTYESISGLSVPHGVGSVWAQALWEVYWSLVDVHGFDPDLYNAFGGAGNQRAMLYVNEGLKNTACSPTFVDTRDGVIQAATDNFAGEDVCTLWDAFAAFGLGVDAVSGGANSTNPTNGFALPASCTGSGTDFQFGTETIDEQIRTVTLSGFTNPIVVMGPPSFNGTQPATVRVRNVTPSSFQHNLQEWDYLDGTHINESIGFLALEAGTSTLGSLAAEAGSVAIDHNWTTVSLNQTFVATPVVVAQVVTFNGNQAVTTRIRNVTASSFEVRLQEEEGNDGTHAVETVHFIALETGATNVNGTELVVGSTGDVVTEAFSVVNFGTSVSNPALLADMQTFDGSNPATLRHAALSSTTFEVKVEEEQSLDNEVVHTTEEVGFIVIGN